MDYMTLIVLKWTEVDCMRPIGPKWPNRPKCCANVIQQENNSKSAFIY